MEKHRIEELAPEEIEARSFAIIQEELQEELPENLAPIIMRVIHTTADFSYAKRMYFSPQVIETVHQAFLAGGCQIITDTNMVQAGINKEAMRQLGIKLHCFIGHEEVRRRARAEGQTRSRMAIDFAFEAVQGPKIFVLGNAPTALLRLVDLKGEQGLAPVAAIGVPVGFVNVEVSKEALIASGIPCIVNRGRKGGSNVAAAIVNALAYMLTRS